MLNKLLKTGDLVFVQGDSWVSKAIRKITSGTTNHVGLVYDSETIFETDLSWGKAQLHPLARYEHSRIYVVRLKSLSLYSKQMSEIKTLCQKYDATPYSFLDIMTNFIFSPFNDKIRENVVSKLGTRKFAICSELSARILFEATKYQPFKKYEGLTPQDLLTKTQLFHRDWEVVLNRFV